MQPGDERHVETRPILEFQGIGFDYERVPKYGGRTLKASVSPFSRGKPSD